MPDGFGEYSRSRGIAACYVGVHAHRGLSLCHSVLPKISQLILQVSYAAQNISNKNSDVCIVFIIIILCFETVWSHIVEVVR